MTGQEIKELQAVNETELSQAADALLKAEPHREESGLILEGVLLTVADKINRENSPKERLYVLDRAVEVIQGRIWNLKLSPKEKYRALTENADLDKEENEGLLEDLTEIAKGENAEPDEWILLTLAQELLENLGSWFDLEPEFPELL